MAISKAIIFFMISPAILYVATQQIKKPYDVENHVVEKIDMPQGFGLAKCPEGEARVNLAPGTWELSFPEGCPFVIDNVPKNPQRMSMKGGISSHNGRQEVSLTMPTPSIIIFNPTPETAHDYPHAISVDVAE